MINKFANSSAAESRSFFPTQITCLIRTLSSKIRVITTVSIKIADTTITITAPLKKATENKVTCTLLTSTKTVWAKSAPVLLLTDPSWMMEENPPSYSKVSEKKSCRSYVKYTLPSILTSSNNSNYSSYSSNKHRVFIITAMCTIQETKDSKQKKMTFIPKALI